MKTTSGGGTGTAAAAAATKPRPVHTTRLYANEYEAIQNKNERATEVIKPLAFGNRKRKNSVKDICKYEHVCFLFRFLFLCGSKQSVCLVMIFARTYHIIVICMSSDDVCKGLTTSSSSVCLVMMFARTYHIIVICMSSDDVCKDLPHHRHLYV